MEVESRTLDQLRQHYEIEKRLAGQLRAAGRDERLHLYASLYDELFRRVPLHPQLQHKADPAIESADIATQVRMLRRYLRPGSTFLEIGPGDCALSIAVAARVRHVYAVDVSAEIVSGLELPGNVEVRLSDGTSIPVAAGAVDVAYSNQLMEHLHPDDCVEQLRNVYEALAPSGTYVCITPNGLSGPHDISKHFDTVAMGFHLKEYTAREAGPLFRGVGFRHVSVLLGGRGHYLETRTLPLDLFEACYATLPATARRRLGKTLPVSGLLGLRLVARK